MGTQKNLQKLIGKKILQFTLKYLFMKYKIIKCFKNQRLNNSHVTENVTKAVDHKPIDSKTCTEFRELLSYNRGHSSNIFNIDACSDKNYT